MKTLLGEGQKDLLIELHLEVAVLDSEQRWQRRSPKDCSRVCSGCYFLRASLATLWLDEKLIRYMGSMTFACLTANIRGQEKEVCGL